MHQLAELAALCPDWGDQIVSLMIDLCVGTDFAIKREALYRISIIAKAVPRRARSLTAVLLHHCASDSRQLRKIAKAQLSDVLRICPEKAIEILQAVVDYEAANPHPPKQTGRKRQREQEVIWGSLMTS